MKSKYASALSDAIAKTRHPRLDYRTEEARKCTDRLHPFLKKAIRSGDKVLDLGCGAGKFTFEMEQLGGLAVGLDCSQQAIHLAQQIASETGSSAKFYIGLYDNISFPDNYFDIVLFPSNIVECSYTEMDSIAYQIQKILQNKGKLYLEMQDGFEKCANGGFIGEIDVATGKKQEFISIPEQGQFPYETTFWTVAFAKFIISRYLKLVTTERVDNKRYLLEFIKQKV